jgi:glyoxylase-like metal-dependent hydrolase (beta-lactamase superfamily II)
MPSFGTLRSPRSEGLPPKEKERDISMIVKGLVVGPLQVNCYLVGCEETKEGIVIDPGGDAPVILSQIHALELNIAYIINTHGHIDHVAANRSIKEATSAPIAIHRLDAPWLTNPQGGLALLLGVTPGPPADIFLEEGDEVRFGKISLKVLHTPGHTTGGISLWGEEIIFTGDALFKMGIGRTDLPGGDFKTLIKSIRTKLFTLPEETVVYPGHGPATTIGREKRTNPFVP